MCGICGIAAGDWLTGSDAELFGNLLFLNQLRGQDATGVVCVRQPSDKDRKKHRLKTIHYKEAVEASEFLLYGGVNPAKKSLLWEAIPGNDHNSVMIGHTRSATVGEATDSKNAHPFEFENVIGVHNGTIRKDFRHSKEFKTDSEALYFNIDRYGIDDALQEVEDYAANTAYALVYVNKAERTLNFIRNLQRPLHFATWGGGNYLAWSSERWMLEGAINRKSEYYKPEFSLPKVMHLYTFDLLQKEWTKHPTIREIKIKSKYVYNDRPNHNHNNHNRTTQGIEHWGHGDAYRGWDEDYAEYAQSDKAESEAAAQTELAKSIAEMHNANLPPLLPPPEQFSAIVGNIPAHLQNKIVFLGFKGEQVARARMIDFLKEGCTLCGKKHEISEPDLQYKLGWYDREAYICDTCQTTGENTKWVNSHMVNWKNKKSIEKSVG